MSSEGTVGFAKDPAICVPQAGYESWGKSRRLKYAVDVLPKLMSGICAKHPWQASLNCIE
jgi:hypothetical protein